MHRCDRTDPERRTDNIRSWHHDFRMLWKSKCLEPNQDNTNGAALAGTRASNRWMDLVNFPWVSTI